MGFVEDTYQTLSDIRRGIKGVRDGVEEAQEQLHTQLRATELTLSTTAGRLEGIAQGQAEVGGLCAAIGTQLGETANWPGALSNKVEEQGRLLGQLQGEQSQFDQRLSRVEVKDHVQNEKVEDLAENCHRQWIQV